MTYTYPWYDSPWLRTYMQAQEIIKQHAPHRLAEFINAFDPLRTRPDYQVEKINEVFEPTLLKEIRDFVDTLKTGEMEKQELLNFGRLVVHDDPYFNQLQKKLTDLVSERVQEPVEPCYNFLSLYNNLGVCKVHMDV